MTDFILAIVLVLLVIFVIDHESSESYYNSCTQQHSYSRCFYNHILKPD